MEDGPAFLSAEAETWAPFLALAGLTDADLERSIEAAHGWTGRDLMAHLVFWQEVAVDLARDLAVGDESPSAERVSAQWAAKRDAWNEEILEEWRAKPLAEVRARFDAAPSDLRAALASAPEVRWWGNPEHRETLLEETVEHYADHIDELSAIVAAAGR